MHTYNIGSTVRVGNRYRSVASIVISAVALIKSEDPQGVPPFRLLGRRLHCKALSLPHHLLRAPGGSLCQKVDS